MTLSYYLVQDTATALTGVTVPAIIRRRSCSVSFRLLLMPGIDDGEPGGTAGRPMLDTLAGAGLCNVCAGRFVHRQQHMDRDAVRIFRMQLRNALLRHPVLHLSHVRVVADRLPTQVLRAIAS